MTTKKDLVIAILATFCLTMTLFVVIPTRSASTSGTNPEYDPWCDLDDDGQISLYDAVNLLSRYGAKGTPKNKTALLLELQAKIDSLNASLVDLQSRVGDLETRTPKKGYISISPAAFTSGDNTHSYYKSEWCLKGAGAFWASLQLPNGVTLKNFTARLIDMSTMGSVYVYLMGFNLTKGLSLTSMAGFSTGWTETPGDVTLYDDTIADARIDTKNCEYAIATGFSQDDYYLYLEGIVIEYEYP